MRSVARTAHLVVALLLVAGLVAQIFLAGLGVFRSPESFLTHRDFGYMLELLPVLLLVLGLIAGLGRRMALLAAGMFGLFLLQSVFVGLRETAPEAAALHPVNGFLSRCSRSSWPAMRGSAGGRRQPEGDEPGGVRAKSTASSMDIDRPRPRAPSKASGPIAIGRSASSRS